MWREAYWIGLPEEEIKKKEILQGDMNGRFAYYRCSLDIEEEASVEIAITANSRYRLWVNGNSVLSGPCKGDWFRQYYETVSLTEFLVKGKNVFAVQVLFCDPNAVVHQYEELAPLVAVAGRPSGHRLAVEGSIINNKQETIGTITSGVAPWRVYLDGSFRLTSSQETMNLGAVIENIDFGKSVPDWKRISFQDENWARVRILESVMPTGVLKTFGILKQFIIKERPIPLLYEKCGTLEAFEGAKHLKVEAGEHAKFVIDAGVIKNAYPVYSFEGGTGTTVKITYAEKYTNKEKEISRTDHVNGKIAGIQDVIILSGKEVVYEPFWYRTFRFVKIEIWTAGEAVLVRRPIIYETGYPINTQTWIKSSEKWVEKLWDMCVRTLQNCMTETYMDCPYYEQLQYVMDTRLQALFHYTVSTDTRLAKKALMDFHHSITPEGLVQSRYPSCSPQIIPIFSLHYIFMLYEYFFQTEDMELLREYRTDVDRILEYYHQRIGTDDLVGKLGYWEFVDWLDAWEKNAGVPDAIAFGPSTIVNLVYANALSCAANIYELTGRRGTAREYQERRKRILTSVQKHCWDEGRGLFKEGPHLSQYTQHAQCLAVQNGMLSEADSVLLMKKALSEADVLKCTFASSYDLFRALENNGMYSETKQLMDEWIHLLSLDCTTCPETPRNARSECHAWSALPMYEMVRVLAGIRQRGIGWNETEIRPHLIYLPDLQGEVLTPKGMIRFCYHKDETGWEYCITIPEGMKASFINENGVRKILKRGENKWKER